MTWHMGFVLLVLVFMFVGLAFEWASPAVIVCVTLVIFIVTGVLSPAQALSGFSNEGVFTIALLFILSGAIQQSGFFQQFIHLLMGKKHAGKWSLLRMMMPVSVISSFLNNTPIVVALMPYVRKWCLDHRISPSKFLIPLSYATILGGMVTLMGTSTNLVIHGLLLENDLKGFTFFQLAYVGIPAVIIGWIYLTFY
ncbi:MAG: SLC13 family permease, partial [Tuberibacillus sp.]